MRIKRIRFLEIPAKASLARVFPAGLSGALDSRPGLLAPIFLEHLKARLPAGILAVHQPGGPMNPKPLHRLLLSPIPTCKRIPPGQVWGPLLWICLLSLIVSGPLRAAVLLSELMLDPLGPEGSDEFVELYNTGPDTVDLADWHLQEGSSRDALVFETTSLLAPGAWLLVLDEAYAGGFDSLIAPDALRARIDNATLGNGGLANGGGEWIELLDSQDQAVDALLTPGGGEPGFSWERAGEQPFCDGCFQPSARAGGSPGGRNRHQLGDWALCAQLPDLAGLELRACGRQGFRSQVRLFWQGQLFRQDSLDWAPDTRELWPLPILEWGQHALRLETGPQDQPETLLDTLLWNPASGPGSGLWLSELQPAGAEGADWVELATDRPVILDGFQLDWGRDPLPLAGRLEAGQFLLVGPATGGSGRGCRPDRIEPQPVTVDRGGAWPCGRPTGQVLETCHPGPPPCWSRGPQSGTQPAAGPAGRAGPELGPLCQPGGAQRGPPTAAAPWPRARAGRSALSPPR
jgi:hypothetical protein